MGPSGSGKSTLLHIMAGLDTPTSGRVWLGDQEVSGFATRSSRSCAAARSGSCSSRSTWCPPLDVLGNVELPFELDGASPPPPSSSGSTTCWSRSNWCRGSSTARRSSPAGSSSGSRSPVRSARARSWSLPTSRPATSTRTPAARCSPSCVRRVPTTARASRWVTHDPIAASYADRVPVPRRRTDRRRDRPLHGRADQRARSSGWRRHAMKALAALKSTAHRCWSPSSAARSAWRCCC